MELIVKEVESGSSEGTVLRGAVNDLWKYQGPEAMVDWSS